MTKQITHICFDLDDTLYEQITPFKQALLSVRPVQESCCGKSMQAFACTAMNCFSCIRERKFPFRPCI